MNNVPHNIIIINPTGGSPHHGPNLRSFHLAKNLTQRGFNVKIVANSYFHKFHNIPNISKKVSNETIESVDYVWIKSNKYRGRGILQLINQITFAFRLLVNYKKIFFQNTDVIIYSSPTPFAIISTAIIARKINAKLIYEIRDMWPLVIKELGDYSSFHPLIIILDFLAKFAYKKSNHIISVKPGDLRFLEKKYNVLFKKMSYMPNGYDSKNLYRTPLSNNLKKKIPKDKFIIGYVGSISVAYSVEQLVKAAERIKNKKIHFLIVGDGPFILSLKKYIKLHKIRNVSLLGRIDSTQVPEVISKFNICFVGYKKANWLRYGVSSNKIYDYMSQKKPIIAALESDYNPIYLAKCGLITKSEDYVGIANAIEKLYMLGKSELKKLGKNGNNYLLKNHSFDKITNEYIKVIKLIHNES